MDDGNRLVEVVTSSDFNSSARIKALKVAQTISEEGAGLSPLNKGDIVVINIEDADIIPTHTPTYILPFLVGEILTNLTESGEYRRSRRAAGVFLGIFCSVL